MLIHGSELKYLEPFTLILLGGYVEGLSARNSLEIWESTDVEPAALSRRTLGSGSDRVRIVRHYYWTPAAITSSGPALPVRPSEGGW